MYLWNYNILTNAGHGVEPMLQALYQGNICSYSYEQGLLIRPESYQEKLLNTWSDHFQNFLNTDLELNTDFCAPTTRWGVILATTKGHIEDYIWKPKSNDKNSSLTQLKPQTSNPPASFNLSSSSSGSPSLSPSPSPSSSPPSHSCPSQPCPPIEPGAVLLKNFLARTSSQAINGKKIRTPQQSLSISQACSSSHIAFEVAQHWIQWKWVDYVLILAGDLIGPFVTKGFASLKLISALSQKPFDAQRDGLFLGDAVGSAIVSGRKPSRPCIRFNALTNYTEGAVTRPSLSGDSLYTALQNLHRTKNTPQPQPDFVVAHGTGTRFNDTAEDRALARYFTTNRLEEVPVLGAKWCLGHTLGGSGMVDLIAASEVLNRQQFFTIASSHQYDPGFHYKNYLLANKQTSSINQVSPIRPLKEALITSLGFGGVHAAAWMERISK